MYLLEHYIAIKKYVRVTWLSAIKLVNYCRVINKIYKETINNS